MCLIAWIISEQDIALFCDQGCQILEFYQLPFLKFPYLARICLKKLQWKTCLHKPTNCSWKSKKIKTVKVEFLKAKQEITSGQICSTLTFWKLSRLFILSELCKMSRKQISTKNYYQRIYQLCVCHTVEYFGNTRRSEFFFTTL